MKCKNFAAFVQCGREVLSEVTDNEHVIVLLTFLVADEVSSDLLCDMVEYSDMRPMQIPAYGDRLPTMTSYYMHGNADHHVEARVRIAVEFAVHEDLDLDDNFPAKGISGCTSKSTIYAMFSDLCQPGTNISSTEIRRLFQEKTISVVKPGEYIGKSMPYHPYLEQE